VGMGVSVGTGVSVGGSGVAVGGGGSVGASGGGGGGSVGGAGAGGWAQDAKSRQESTNKVLEFFSWRNLLSFYIFDKPLSFR